MPIKKASIKSLRQAKKRTASRAKVRKELEMNINKMRRLLNSKKKDEGQKLANQVQQMIDKAAKQGVISQNKADRIKSRLMKALARL